MRRRGALGRALARAGASRHGLPASRLRMRTHRWLSTPAGGVPLHYLRTPRLPRGARLDGHLTVRVLLAEARAARAASVHAWLVCMTAARDLVTRMGHVAERGMSVRGAPASRWAWPGTSRAAAVLRGAPGEAGPSGRMAREALRLMERDTPGRMLLRVLWSPRREAPRTSSMPWRERRRIELTRVLHTLASSSLLASTRTFLRELTSRHVSSGGGSRVAAAHPAEPAQRNAPAARSSAAAQPHTVFQALTLAYLSIAEATGQPFLAAAETPRRVSAHTHQPALRLRLPAMLISVRHGDAIQATAQRPVHRRSGTPPASAISSAIMRVRTPPRAIVATPQARAAAAMARGYAAPAAALTFRRTPRVTPADSTSQTRQLQQQVVRQVTQELAQHTPWRGQLEQAVLAPRVLRELADRVAGAIAGRQGLERYRRGL